MNRRAFLLCTAAVAVIAPTAAVLVDGAGMGGAYFELPGTGAYIDEAKIYTGDLGTFTVWASDTDAEDAEWRQISDPTPIGSSSAIYSGTPPAQFFKIERDLDDLSPIYDGVEFKFAPGTIITG